jgi:flagellar hook-length control protein FliK
VNQQLDAAQLKEVTSGDKPAGQGQANVSNLSLNAALPNQGQSPTGPTVQADASAAVQPLPQQGDSTQTSSGDGRSDSKSTASAGNVSTAASTSSNAAATTAFTVPDQASGEARLPITTMPAAQSVDAARQAQAQAAVNTGDNDSLNTARLTRGLANAVQQRGGAVTLRLTPPEMGTVRIQMQITGTNVSASFHAETSSAQTLLTTQLAQLRSALESKGMSVDRLTVQPLATTASSQNSSQSQSQNDAQQQGQQQNAGDGRSRGQYSGDSSRQQSSDSQQDSGTNQQAPRGFFDNLNDAAEEQAA